MNQTFTIIFKMSLWLKKLRIIFHWLTIKWIQIIGTANNLKTHKFRIFKWDQTASNQEIINKELFPLCKKQEINLHQTVYFFSKKYFQMWLIKNLHQFRLWSSADNPSKIMTYSMNSWYPTKRTTESVDQSSKK